jgi:hypothetical protein
MKRRNKTNTLIILSLLLSLLFLISAGISIIILYLEYPLETGLLLGVSRIFFAESDTCIFLNGKKSNDSLIYHETKTFKNKKVDWYILLINREKHEDRLIIIIDIQNKLVGLPNFSVKDYKVINTNWLLQKDSGDWFTPFTSEKSGLSDAEIEQFNSDFQIKGNKIDSRAYCGKAAYVMLAILVAALW